MGKNQDQGSGIRDKHPGSATLGKSKEFSCFEVLFCGLKASPVTWASFFGGLGISKRQFFDRRNRNKIFSLTIYFNF
jgi:hypothetical protein